MRRFPRGFEFEYHLPLAVDTQVRDADRRSRDVAVQLFQPFAITRLAVHACMQREPVHLDAWGIVDLGEHGRP